jgi:hypothetical protein
MQEDRINQEHNIFQKSLDPSYYGFRSAFDIAENSKKDPSPNYPLKRSFCTNYKIKQKEKHWDPLSLVQKISNNLPLNTQDYSSPILVKYLDFFDRLCRVIHNATSREILAILAKSGRIKLNQFYILL